MNFFLLTTALLKLMSIGIAKPYENIASVSHVTSDCEYSVIDQSNKSILQNFNASFSQKNNLVFSTKNPKTKLTSMQFIDKTNILIGVANTDSNDDTNNPQKLTLFNPETQKCNLLYSSNLDIKYLNFNTASNTLAFVVNNTIYGYNLENNKTLSNIYEIPSPVKVFHIALNYNGKVLIVARETSVLGYKVQPNKLPIFLFKRYITITEFHMFDPSIIDITFAPKENLFCVRIGNSPKHHTPFASAACYELINDTIPKQKKEFYYMYQGKLFWTPKQKLIITNAGFWESSHNIVHLHAYCLHLINKYEGDSLVYFSEKYEIYKHPKNYTKEEPLHADKKLLIDYYAVDNNKNIIAITTSDDRIKILQLSINCNNHTLNINDLVDEKLFGILGDNQILSFNSDTSKLAILTNNVLHVYLLNLKKAIDPDNLNYCYSPTTKTENVKISDKSEF
jgi:hypothetical protein